MRLVRRRNARGKLATASCHTCGHDITLVDPHPAASVEHRCSTGVVGPVWTIVEPPAGRDLAAVAEQAQVVA